MKVCNEYGANCSIMVGLGHIYNAQKNFIWAREYLGEAINLEKDKKTASCSYGELGLLYLNTGKIQEVEDNFKKAIEINPDIE